MNYVTNLDRKAGGVRHPGSTKLLSITPEKGYWYVKVINLENFKSGFYVPFSIENSTETKFREWLFKKIEVKLLPLGPIGKMVKFTDGEGTVIEGLCTGADCFDYKVTDGVNNYWTTELICNI